MAEVEQKEVARSVEGEVARWQRRIVAAKAFHEESFCRMQEDMEFVGGIQWPDQEDLNEDRYIANITMREVNQAVSSLYARDPKAIAQRRERLDNTVWDGRQESLVNASQQMVMSMQTMGMADPNAMAVLQDYSQVEAQRDMVDRLAKTLEIWYQVQVDRQEPKFKLQMKQLVRRVKVTGVGFVRIHFKRTERLTLSTSSTSVPLTDRAKRLSALIEDYENRKFDENDSKVEELKMLASSINYGLQDASQTNETNERLEFDFPSATSVIVDPTCRIIKGFVGARWVAVEYILPIEEVRSFFEVRDLEVGSGHAKEYSSKGTEVPAEGAAPRDDDETFVAVWEVFNKVNRTRFFMCDGWKDYLMAPEEPRPCVQRFWPIIPITFNDTETERSLKVSIYPPSDVRLMRSMQCEWNRSREGLRKHRIANAPKYFAIGNVLTDMDKEKLRKYPDSAVIELQATLPPGTNIDTVVKAFVPAPISPDLYTSDHLERDVALTVGAQPENLGAQGAETATGATIEEQSRISSINSNVDDLDELLTEMAEVGGEMGLREASIENVKRDVGQGAVWPQTEESRQEVIDRVYLQVQASSTGRPNQGLRIAHIRDIAPLLLSAGANPQFIVEEVVKAYDERINVQRAFPIMPPGMMSGSPMGAASAPASPSGSAGQQAESNRTTAGPPMPLPIQTDATSSNL